MLLRCILAALIGAALAAQARAQMPMAVAVTQTVQTLGADTDVTLTGTGGPLRMLCVMNIGTGLVNLAFDAAATAGTGWALNAAGGAGQAGGSICWNSGVVPSNVVHARSLAGSTVVTLVGKR